MSNEFKGLWLTQEVREDLHFAIEEAIKCHFSAQERAFQKREDEARAERLRAYDETLKICDDMIENRAMEILFSKYDAEGLQGLLYEREERKFAESEENT